MKTKDWIIVTFNVLAIRQVCLSFKKIELQCEPERVRQSVERFVETERDLSTISVPGTLVDDFVNVSRVLYDNALSTITLDDLRPKHGPGATVEGVSGNGKYRWQFWHERLEPYFPFVETAYTLGCYDSKEFHDVTLLTEEQELPVKVTPVPKTLKGPRIIAIEPCCMQYVQQSIRKELYKLLERSHYTRGHVNFTDQEINRSLAISASSDGRLATIDLSDASDRVLHDLAIRMFDGNPNLRDAIVACRSSRAKLPDGRIIGPLSKFASMGSALCFPVESMYFYTICIVALLRRHNLPVTSRNVYFVSRDVYVYGDDIFVPADEAVTVTNYLHKYHCRVNMSKSFWTGKFRESCGMDAYDGVEVTPTYLRQIAPSDRRQANILVSWIKTANAFYKKGYWQTSSYMFSVCERYLGKLPYVSENSSGLGRTHFGEVCTVERRNKLLQRPEVRAWVPEPVYRTDILGGYGALLKCLFMTPKSPYGEEGIDNKHLERSARHGAVTLKRRWIGVA